MCRSDSGFHHSLRTRSVCSSCWGHQSATWGRIWHKFPPLWVAGRCLLLQTLQWGQLWKINIIRKIRRTRIGFYTSKQWLAGHRKKSVSLFLNGRTQALPLSRLISPPNHKIKYIWFGVSFLFLDLVPVYNEEVLTTLFVQVLLPKKQWNSEQELSVWFSAALTWHVLLWQKHDLLFFFRTWLSTYSIIHYVYLRSRRVLENKALIVFAKWAGWTETEWCNNDIMYTANHHHVTSRFF